MKADNVSYPNSDEHTNTKTNTQTNTKTKSNKLKRLVSESVYLEMTVTNSELEALLLEQHLIKEIKPKFKTDSEIYGVPSLTAYSLISEATYFKPIDEKLLLGY